MMRAAPFALPAVGPMRKSGRRLVEQKIHWGVVNLLNTLGAKGLVFFHPGNNPRSPRDGMRLKRLGAKAGVPDLILVHNGIVYALEIKNEKGRTTKDQDDFIDAFKLAGGYAEVGYGLEHCMKILDTWGLVRGRIM